MNDEYEYRIKKFKDEAEKKLQDRISKLHFAPQTTKEEKENTLKAERERFWKTKQPEIDNHKQILGAVIFEDYGGSQSSARKMMEDYQTQHGKLMGQFDKSKGKDNSRGR